MNANWSTHQLTEYFAAVSAVAEEAAATRVALERALEALDAEIGALVIPGRVHELIGLPGPLPVSVFEPVIAGAGELVLPRVGETQATYAALGSNIDGGLVVARADGGFSAEERQMLRGMAQVLGLALRNLRTLAVERALREEQEREAAHRLQLLEEVRTRQALLETLLAIQRAISKREPLQSVLDAITEGASDLLDRSSTALVLPDPADPAHLLLTSMSRWPVSAAATAAALGAAGRAVQADATIDCPAAAGDSGLDVYAAPVHVNNRAAGSLVIRPSGPELRADHLQMLSAFAQQISLALTDAHAVEAFREARHDVLTGLPNRKQLLERLREALAAPGGRSVTVLFIDLDRFKAVNDSLGHQAGDELLTQVGGRIGGCLRGDDIPARLGGDEFAVLLTGVPMDVARRVAQRISGELAKPFDIAGRAVLIGASIGIATGGPAGVDAATLLSNADVAMYRAKKDRAGQVVAYEPAMHDELMDRLDLQSHLEQALRRDELYLEYQPLLRLDSGQFHGVEALLRWQHTERGTISPATFIPVAEDTGLIVEIGRWVLFESLRQLAAWRRLRPELQMNVNVSARQIVRSGFVADVTEALAAAGLPGCALTLELTETSLMSDPATVLRHIQELKAVGVSFSVDDFGTGYSSLSHLQRFPVDELKVDRAFVAGLSQSRDGRTLVQAVIGLGRALDLRIVAEGIEDETQLLALQRMECHLGQGYHLYRPMPAQRCTELLEHSVSRTA